MISQDQLHAIVARKSQEAVAQFMLRPEVQRLLRKLSPDEKEVVVTLTANAFVAGGRITLEAALEITQGNVT